MGAVGEEAFEPRLGLRRRIGPRDAGDVEAALIRLGDEGGFDLKRICQKSKSA